MITTLSLNGWAGYGREGGRTNGPMEEVSQSRSSKYTREAGANFCFAASQKEIIITITYT